MYRRCVRLVDLSGTPAISSCTGMPWQVSVALAELCGCQKPQLTLPLSHQPSYLRADRDWRAHSHDRPKRLKQWKPSVPPVLRQMPRRLCEPLCIAFGTSVSSPTAPTYQLYDLPHKLKPRLYMEAREPWRVVREMKGWEQAATAEARSFLHDLLADRSAHDTFYVQLPVPGASNRCRLLQGIVVLTQKHLRIRQTKESCFQLTAIAQAVPATALPS